MQNSKYVFLGFKNSVLSITFATKLSPLNFQFHLPSHTSAITYTGIITPPGPFVKGLSTGVFVPNDGLLAKGDLDLILSFSDDFSVESRFLLVGLKLFDLTTGGSFKVSGSDNSLISLDGMVTSLEMSPLFHDNIIQFFFFFYLNILFLPN